MRFSARRYASRKLWYSIGNYQRKQEAYERKYGNPLLRSLKTILGYLFVLASCWIIFGDNLAVFWWLLLIVSFPAIVATGIGIAVLVIKMSKPSDKS